MSGAATSPPGVACPTCLRRARLLALVAGGLEVAHKRRRPIRDVLALSDAALLAAASGRTDERALRERLAAFDPFELLIAAADTELEVLCRHTADYPEGLADDRSAPHALFVRGGEAGRARLSALLGADRPLGTPQPVASIVGTRRASVEGVEIAKALGRGLASAGVTVVSGLALGVDSAAHEGALEAGGGTIAVLAGGADVPYPASKAGLYDAIVASGGAIVSEMPPRFRAFRWNFPARNRIIAGLAPATIVVEAAERSGSLITADLALELGRDVGAVPGPVLSWRSRGTNALLRDGATLVRDAADALELTLGIAAAHEALRRAESERTLPPATLEPELAALLAAVEDGQDTVSALTPDAAGASIVTAGLMELELLGLIRRMPGGRVARTTRAGML
ncbi:MAG TPA: DNA-processing protein DprA [Baekduia sp.]|uniref:DNA-processing protein DprA n=1 Tax=Baekduia sp. TaxID=2600305 RepID=UPI002D78D4FD|nr:DNA-processing protein DprA [Baekduia sp.]HET6508517.1 DNA-processing protein DprA [Baekduia sp.]